MCLAVPGRLVEIRASDDPMGRSGKVSFGGVLKEVSLAYLPEARVGDYVTVHVGLALSIVDPEDAALVFALLREAGEASPPAEAGAAGADSDEGARG